MRKATRQRYALKTANLTPEEKHLAKQRRRYLITGSTPAGRYLLAKAQVGK